MSVDYHADGTRYDSRCKCEQICQFNLEIADETAGSDTFEVNFANGRSFNLNEVRGRAEAFMVDGGHAWVVSVIYGVDDPDKAMDELSLGAEEFVGVTPIRCLVCNTRYDGTNRHHKCPQVLVES